jgi:uncharacterized protein (DUF1786 family)
MLWLAVGSVDPQVQPLFHRIVIPFFSGGNDLIFLQIIGLVMPILAVDVGAGTQDILLYRDDIALESSPKMVMPSQTVIVARRIDQARLHGRDVFLSGPVMGGGASSKAVKRHLDAGLKVYATPDAALTISDDLSRVRDLGVEIVRKPPTGVQKIETCDLDISLLKNVLDLFSVDMPEEVAVAVQDHGFSPDRSNRIVRFENMARMIEAGGRPESFAYRDPPLSMTRMCAVKKYLEDQGYRAMVMDTGPAAILGATLDPHYIEPALVLNLGSGHTIGAVMDGGRIMSLFEHHTSLLTSRKLKTFCERLCDGLLTNSEIFDDGGHGAYIEGAIGKGAIKSVIVTGPNRNMALESGALFGNVVAAAPGGDMMITGCLGLIEAWKG